MQRLGGRDQLGRFATQKGSQRASWREAGRGQRGEGEWITGPPAALRAWTLLRITGAVGVEDRK